MVAGVRFKKAGKIYSFDAGAIELSAGDNVIVEVEKGIGFARVVSAPIAKDEASVVHALKKIVRKADTVDMERNSFNEGREKEAHAACKDLIVKYKLPMKLVGVEYLFDSSKAIFFFTAENRVDFRDLVRDLAAKFYTRIEMKQIGVRDEAKFAGGFGPCGRELCCASFLTNFAPVTVRMAKDQNLALNPQKISGICGRLMCCLSYEHDGPCHKKDKKKEHSCTGCGDTAAAPGQPGEAAAKPAFEKRPGEKRHEHGRERFKRQGERAGREPRRMDRGERKDVKAPGAALGGETAPVQAEGAAAAGAPVVGTSAAGEQQRDDRRGRGRNRRRRGRNRKRGERVGAQGAQGGQGQAEKGASEQRGPEASSKDIKDKEPGQ